MWSALSDDFFPHHKNNMKISSKNVDTVTKAHLRFKTNPQISSMRLFAKQYIDINSFVIK